MSRTRSTPDTNVEQAKTEVKAPIPSISTPKPFTEFYWNEGSLLTGHLLKRSAIATESLLEAFSPDGEQIASLPFGRRRVPYWGISDWEVSATDSGSSSVNEKHLFQRIDPRPQPVLRRSLITTMMHTPEHAAKMALHASKSQPALRRSKTSSPSGPSLAASLEDGSAIREHVPQVPGARPTFMNTSNIHPAALSPRITRRNILATELSESLCKHILWERQQKNTTAAAVLEKRHTANDVANLQEFPQASQSGTVSKNNSWRHYFEHGLGEYHHKGW
jgi:hypothetical protein